MGAALPTADARRDTYHLLNLSILAEVLTKLGCGQNVCKVRGWRWRDLSSETSETTAHSSPGLAFRRLPEDAPEEKLTAGPA